VIATEAPPRPLAHAGRIPALDAARGLALCAMVVVHVVVDLELVGLVPPGTSMGGAWPVLARTTAGSFLFLAGVSLWLAHGAAIRWRAFAVRLARLVAAAAAVSAATWLALPDLFVHFGILHAIAASSVIGLAALRLPAAATLALAAAALAAPGALAGPAFDRPGLWWTGLAAAPPPSMDYVPVLPWLAPCLAGIAAARLAGAAGLWPRLAALPAPRALARAGRHSLIIYLVHQPVLLAALFPLALILR